MLPDVEERGPEQGGLSVQSHIPITAKKEPQL